MFFHAVMLLLLQVLLYNAVPLLLLCTLFTLFALLVTGYFGGWQCISAVWCCVQALFALSVWGTVEGGYVFSLHLLNIVANNEMLKQVVKAVTKNGSCGVFSPFVGGI